MPRTAIRSLLQLTAFVIAAIGVNSVAGEKVYRCSDPVSHRPVISQVPCTGPESATQIAAAASEARQAAIAAQILAAARNDDVQLLRLYPDEASHRMAHVADLETVARKIRSAMIRFDELQGNRRALASEREFYKGRPLPLALQSKVDANEAAFAAQADIFDGLRRDIANIEAPRAVETDRLRSLWAGARPGSMGPVFAAPASTPGG